MDLASLCSPHLPLVPHGIYTPEHPCIVVGKGAPATATPDIALSGMKYAVVSCIITSAAKRYMHCKKGYVFCRPGVDVSEAVAKEWSDTRSTRSPR